MDYINLVRYEYSYSAMELFDIMVRRDSSQNKIPLYLVIFEELREKIIEGQYAPGEQLPSEYDLGEIFNVSRTTIRKAIANLANQGLVTSQRGKGVFVRESSKITLSLSNPLTSFEADLACQGIVGNASTIELEEIQASPDIELRLNLLSGESQVYRQRQIISVDESPLALDTAYFPLDVGKVLAEQLQSGFTYAVLDRYGFTLKRAEITLECTRADPQLSKYLNVAVGAPLLVYQYVVRTIDNRIVACGETLSSADRMCYSVVLDRN